MNKGVDFDTIRYAAKKIRLIAVDIDGTLMNDQGQVTAYTRQVLQELADRGYIIVPTTGRNYFRLREKVLQISGIRYMIVANGALVRDGEADRALWQRNIPCETAAALADAFAEDGTLLYITPDSLPSPIRACQNTVLYQRHFQRPGWPGAEQIITGNFAQWIREHKPTVIKFGLWFTRPDGFAIYEPMAARRFPQLNCFRAAANELEFTDGQASKALALQKLCTYLKLSPQQVLAIGDNGNDIAMLQYAGLGVAMGNAIPQAKQAANAIAGSNNEDGAAHFLAELFLA